MSVRNPNGKSMILPLTILCLALLPALTQAANEVKTLNGPTRINNWGSYSLSVEYAADKDDNLALNLKRTSDGKIFGTASVPAKAGTGTLTLELNVTGKPPYGDGYVWEAAIGGPSPIKGGNLSVRSFLNVAKGSGNTWLISASKGYRVEVISSDGAIVETRFADASPSYSWTAGNAGVYIIRASKDGHQMLQQVVATQQR